MQAVQVVLFGLLLSLSVQNEAERCDYFQELEYGQTYYAYNPGFPNMTKNDANCIWQMKSPYDVEVNCSIEIEDSSADCKLTGLSIQIDHDKIFNYCKNDSFSLRGKNPIIRFYSYQIKSKFLCQMNTLLPNNCACGWKKTTRIVGGVETGINEYPMMIGLVDVDNRMIYCGGTIISPKYILTAAHCIDGRNTSRIGAYVGGHDVTKKSSNATKVFRLIGCKTHPGYKNDETAFDVAVCKIDGTIKYSQEVGPACLPFQHSQDSFDGHIVTALGWGLMEFGGKKSDKLQKVNLNVITLKKCKQSLSKAYVKVNVTNKHICTYTPEKDACQMDSGGPYLWQNPTTHKVLLVGIISSGIGCAPKDMPSFAMRTSAFMDWILSVTPDAQYCQVE